MKIRSQVGMVLNLDKCIGCHTCSVTCKNVWTSREGVEYAWFNNVETKLNQQKICQVYTKNVRLHKKESFSCLLYTSRCV